MSYLTTLSFTNPILIGLAVLCVGGLVGWYFGLFRGIAGGATTKLRRSFALALKSLWLHKLRSFLSVLGIIIGTGAVISLMAFGEGSMQDALEDIKRQGATNIIVRSVKPPDESATASKGRVSIYGLVDADLKRFETFGDSIGMRVPMRVFPMEARYLARLSNIRCVATVPEYADVNKLEMHRGRFLMSSDDVEGASDDDHMVNVCVLGSDAADKLFPFEDPLDNKMVQMKNQRFLVVGIVKKRMPTGGSGGSQAAEEFNRDIYIPFKSSFARFGRIIFVRASGSFTSEMVEISQVTLTVNAEVDSHEGRMKVQAVGDEVKRMLEKEHPKLDWAVTVPLDRLEEAERSQNRFTNLMAMIASISLFVGGIGIMNIMLATVTERTREIGIRRALGAKRRDITMQFLVEAVVQTTIGGIVGVVVGIGTVYGVPAAWDQIREWGWFSGTSLPAKLHVPSIFISLVFSVVVGVAFGLYPAWRASKLDPIEALRHD